MVKDKSSLNGAKTPQTFDTDRDTKEMMDLAWPGTDASWLRMTSFGLRRILEYIKDHYGNPRIIITENGCTQAGEHDEVGERALEDYFRVDWYRRYLNEVSFYVILFPMVRNERRVQHRGLDGEGWVVGGGVLLQLRGVSTMLRYPRHRC